LLPFGPEPAVFSSKTKFRGLSPQENYPLSDRHLSAKLVPTFADRGCHVVSVTDPYGNIPGFLDRLLSKNLKIRIYKTNFTCGFVKV
jgi:hypothetical protein